MKTPPSMVIFGSLGQVSRQDEFQQLERALKRDQSLFQPIISALSGLDSVWDSLLEHDSNLSVLAETGRLVSMSFARFVADSAEPELHDRGLFELARHTDQGRGRNMVTMPMTILDHIVQYQDYIKRSGVSHMSLLQSVSTSGAGIQGFCAGLLSAVAVGGASTMAEVMASAAKSIHLAFSVGAYVDADIARSGKVYRSIAVRWRSAGKPANVQEILDKYPDVSKSFHQISSCCLLCSVLSRLLKAAITTNSNLKSYLAITRDEHDMTITARAASLPELQHDLALHGAAFLDIGLTGRYHSAVHEDAPRKIVGASRGLLDAHFGHQMLVLANADGKLINPGSDGVLVLLKSILVDHANWHQTVLTATSGLRNLAEKPSVLVFGSDATTRSDFRAFAVVRWSLTGDSGSSGQATLTIDTSGTATVCSSKSNPDTGSKESRAPSHDGRSYPRDSIAVVGMACKFPGADSIDEFWSLLIDGKSMLSQIPPNRFGNAAENSGEQEHPGSWRTLPGSKFWGNFVNDIEAFDHKFFKKSAREAASMDPQQRLLLQVAYQALASSHYFSVPAQTRDTDMGVYIGSCSTDYDSNVCSHMPTAYATTGTLRAFLSGRISHHFGLTGPSLVFDTACSSSAVAIHTACKALQGGECAQALAGGVTLITSPYLYENLATAHFLSPSGATKPFDAAADGYCRGEGVGLVVLKKLSVALGDGDRVLGVIAGSAVNQNANCVSITVPHSPSQSSLYQRVLAQAGIQPETVAFVEAHGTGTPVGDPIEMESLRQVFGGTERKDSRVPLFVSSVKGNIGHLEGASGVAGLIKALLQMEYRIACQQASFTRLNPRIPCLEKDHLCVPTSNRALSESGESGILTACVNNYGAAGSNATLMLMAAPPKEPKLNRQACDNMTFPIRITAASKASLVRYCNVLDVYLKKLLAADTSSAGGQLLADVAFSLSSQQDPDLAHALTLTASKDVNTLRQSLAVALDAHGRAGAAKREQPACPLPIVLCFGGQVGQHVGLSKRLWSQCGLLRVHLDACDAHLQSMGHPSIYPSIFEESPIEDVGVLQTAIFASQYACARAWLDTGLKVDCVIGHSLGQLAALCVSGILPLRDGLMLVAGRAALMKTHWGAEPGSMMAVEAEKEVVLDLMSRLTVANPSHSLEVACYNSPASQVVVGDARSIDALASKLEASGLRHRRLQVSHGFHSRFTDPLMPHLETLAEELALGKASIALETCTEGESWGGRPTARLIAAHTRHPVFFSQAAGRIHDRLGACTWVEAGGDSGIVGMIRRALDQNRASTRSVKLPGRNDSFVAMELRRESALEKLAEVTVKLWDSGYRAVGFWPFHRGHAAGDGYEEMRLPPYQFEKTRHWLPLELGAGGSRPGTRQAPGAGQRQPELPRALIRPSDKADDAEGRHFHVDALSNEFQALVGGYVVRGNAESPSSLYVELAARAVMQTMGGEDEGGRGLFQVEGLRLGSPLLLATPCADVDLCLCSLPREQSWTFKITSQIATAGLLVHATGTISFGPAVGALRVDKTAPAQAELDRYERLISLSGSSASATSNPESLSATGALVYKLGSPQTRLDLAHFYRNVKSLSLGKCITARVEAPPASGCPVYLKDSVVGLHILDAFLQVAHLHANVIHESPDHFFVLAGLERLQYGLGFWRGGASSETHVGTPAAWNVLALSSEPEPGPGPEECKAGQLEQLTYDIFVQDAAGGKLVAILLGAQFTRVRVDIASPLIMPIPKINSDDHYQSPEPPQPLKSLVLQESSSVSAPAPVSPPVISSAQSIFSDLCTILEQIAEIPRHEVRGNLSFDDLGVDSLMMIEVIAEASSLYRVHLPVQDLEHLTDLDSLVRYLDGRGCRGGNNVDWEIESSPIPLKSVTEGDSPFGSSMTPSTASEDQIPDKPTGLGEHSSIISANVKIQQVQGQQQACSIDSPHPSQVTTRTAQKTFNDRRMDMEGYIEQTKFASFWEIVHPDQARLVQAYIVEAFRHLGLDLASLAAGEQLPLFKAKVLARHASLIKQLHRILLDNGLIAACSSPHELGDDESCFTRTSKPIDDMPAATLLQLMLDKFPQHASETMLMNVTGSVLAECLTGKVDPLRILFANRTNRAVMADVYEKAPMCEATTRFLADFLSSTFKADRSSNGGSSSTRVIQILEVGGGTGGTAKFLVDHLIRQGISFVYRFTDISSSLVSQARNGIFADKHNVMEFATLDCDTVPPPELRERFDVVVATNCIHATRNAVSTAANMASMLRPDGVFCLVEFTRGLHWFDLVYGLLDGWWAFDDGRTHALADQWFWERSLKSAGFGHVAWTDGASAEAQTMRVIAGFLTAPEDASYRPLPRGLVKKAGLPVETFTWKRVGSLELRADVYYPKTADEPGRTRTVGELNLSLHLFRF